MTEEIDPNAETQEVRYEEQPIPLLVTLTVLLPCFLALYYVGYLFVAWWLNW